MQLFEYELMVQTQLCSGSGTYGRAVTSYNLGHCSNPHLNLYYKVYLLTVICLEEEKWPEKACLKGLRVQ